MLRFITICLCLSTTLWSVGLSRSINCHADGNANLHEETPQLKLPWGIYDGKKTDAAGNTTLFQNVRFGRAPTGDLRFIASRFPEAKKTRFEAQDTTSGPICMQAGLPDPKTGKFPPKKDEETEDCLFLDIYVPSNALKKNAESIPVVVYFHGGNFFSGYKDTTLQLGSQTLNLYDGKAIVNASGNDFIWVVGNYRVGAFGWLAGTTMEGGGTPNAGLHDQKLLLEFVHQHIAKVGGDPELVSVWGNSAGAASIMHHMTAGDGGLAGPTIKKAVLWSPSYQWLVDRRGALEDTFKTFTKKAGCDRATLSCLRSADTAVLRNANEEMVKESISKGSFPFGPALDGSYVKYLPAYYLGRNEYRPIDSIIVSNVYDETTLFLPDLSWIDSQANFVKFLKTIFPGDALEDFRGAIEQSYPVNGKDDKKIQQYLRAKRVMGDSNIVCNSHNVIRLRDQKTWAMQFNFPPGLHGSDLLPTIWNSDIDTGKLVDEFLGSYVNETTRRLIESKLAGFSKIYQKYFAGHASYGSPNAFIENKDLHWPEPEVTWDERVEKVLHAGLDAGLKPAFKPLDGGVVNAGKCTAWRALAGNVGDGDFESTGWNAKDKSVKLNIQTEELLGEHNSHLPQWEL